MSRKRSRAKSGQFKKTVSPKKPKVAIKDREFAVILTVTEEEASQFPAGWGSDALKKKMEEVLGRARIILQEHVENEMEKDFNTQGSLEESHIWEPLHHMGIHGIAYRMVWRPNGWKGRTGLPPFAELLSKAEEVKMEDLP